MPKKLLEESSIPGANDIHQVGAEYSDLFAALLPPDQAARHRRQWYQDRKDRHGWTDEEIEAQLSRDSAV